MSRWTMPSAWASASASAIWTARSIARRGFIGRPAIVRLQRLARHVLEHEEQLILILADLVERGDVRMRQRRGRARLLEEPLAPIGIGRDGRGQHLDRDGAAEPRVARAVHLAHAAGADAIEDLVVAEGLEHGTATIILTGRRPASVGATDRDDRTRHS